MMNFRSHKATFGSWSVTGAPRLSLLDGISSKEKPRFRNVFSLWKCLPERRDAERRVSRKRAMIPKAPKVNTMRKSPSLPDAARSKSSESLNKSFVGEA